MVHGIMEAEGNIGAERKQSRAIGNSVRANGSVRWIHEPLHRLLFSIPHYTLPAEAKYRSARERTCRR